MTYKAVFFDIDGTLVDKHKRIPEDTKSAIASLKSTGIDLFIATGRAPSQFAPIAAACGIDSFVSCNGGYVEWRGTPVFEEAISKDILESFKKQAEQAGHALVYAGGHACYATRDRHEDVIEAFDYLDIREKPAYHPDAWRDHDIYQVYLYCKEPEEETYIQQFPQFTFLRAHRLYMDVFPKGVTKAIGIEKMLQVLHASPEQAVAFGDGLNDIQMLSYVGTGIAMGNAREEVKSHANFTTRDVDDGGIVHGLKQIGLLPRVTV